MKLESGEDFMSSEGNDDGMLKEPRPALSDITNTHVKRGFSLVWDNSLIKSENGFGKSYNGKKTAERAFMRGCGSDGSGFDDHGKGKSVLVANERARSLLKGATVFYPLARSSHVAFGSSMGSGTQHVSELPDSLRGSICMENLALCLGSRISTDEGKEAINGTPADFKESLPIGDSSKITSEKLGVEDSSSRRSADYGRVPRLQSQSSNFRLEKCTRSRTDCKASSASTDACTCSFCTKAAFIWTDLHYQDINGRITAVRKSMKEAGVLAQKLRAKMESGLSQGNMSGSQQIEHDLADQWTSLFNRMEGVFKDEVDQLSKEHLAVKNMREECKSVLGSAHEKPYCG